MIAAELRGGSKPSLNEALGWIGSRVDDIYGSSVGRLDDVWIDPGTGVPRWLLVKEGRFGGRTTLIPFEDATAGAGHVWVPYERDVVRDAPEIEPGAPLTQGIEDALRSHYSANAPSAISQRANSAPPSSLGQGPQPGSSIGTATVRFGSGPVEAGSPAALGESTRDHAGRDQQSAPRPLREQRPPAPPGEAAARESGFAPSPSPASPSPDAYVTQSQAAAPRQSTQQHHPPPQGPQPWWEGSPPAPRAEGSGSAARGFRSAPPYAAEERSQPAPPHAAAARQQPSQHPPMYAGARPAPARATPRPPTRQYIPPQPDQLSYRDPDPEGYPQRRSPEWEEPAQPPPPPRAPEPGPRGYEQYPPRAPRRVEDPAQGPVDALRRLAESGGSHYVEIELSGELTIRGELRSVRITPRGEPPR